MNNQQKPKLLKIVLVTFALTGCSSISNIPINTTVVDSKPIPTSQTSNTNTNTNSLNALEQSIHHQINQYRQSRNLPALRLAPSITTQARIHSEGMANKQVLFSHNGFEQRVERIGSTISYRSAAENVAFNQGHSDPATQAVQGWLGSSGHLKNIEGQFDLTGIGASKNNAGEYFFTQIFIKSR